MVRANRFELMTGAAERISCTGAGADMCSLFIQCRCAGPVNLSVRRNRAGNGLMQKLGRLFGWNTKGATASSERATLQMLRRALSAECPGCHQDLSRHSIVLLGLTIASPETTQRVQEFIEAYRSHSWERVTQFQDFDGSCNAVEVFAISCPHGKNSAILVRDPVELYDSDQVLESSVVAERSWLALNNTIIEKEWDVFL